MCFLNYHPTLIYHFKSGYVPVLVVACKHGSIDNQLVYCYYWSQANHAASNVDQGKMEKTSHISYLVWWEKKLKPNFLRQRSIILNMYK